MADVPQHPPITIRRGSTLRSYDYRLTRDGVPIDLTGALFYSDIKPSKVGSKVSAFIFEVTNALDGRFRRKKWVADIPAKDNYVNDLVIVLADGERITMYELRIDVTQNISEWQ